ncbi:hypothetical protein [Paraburkholderia megapolitana]|uniref:Uncharacterized protein n=1 Tax=Paraburkholderia megapolitana TaxID=420953 RepID=A0A1I3GYX9_9BURK|nr:hypothetical protein [Paraburkholderia megapolitana]QDQ83121.1 hypothetical protein FNZ07_18070 [Paraburkholderia megapolitana]SFI28725.1 hypothetical protein SAMN05192543_102766 [Paraburkholderia megapolitana]
MIPPAVSPASFEALPNPRGGAVRTAEAALADAAHAFARGDEFAAPLLRAAWILREAGWLAAQRFTDTLVLVSPLAAAHVEPTNTQRARAVFAAALDNFRVAVERRNLRELSCSPALFAHYRALDLLLAQRTPGVNAAFEDLALAGRPIPPATFSPQPADRLAHLRARYEQALLPVLRAPAGAAVQTAEAAGATDTRAALDTLGACLTELAGPDPYDFWRLAAACADALRTSAHVSGDADLRRFHARCNLALADHARGIVLAPRSLVRLALALLWRDYALFGAAAEDADHVTLLRDYGLTTDWHVAGTQASEALWEAGTIAADATALRGDGATRELGVLTVNAHAFEDFLQTADAAIAALSDHARAALQPDRADPSAALQAGDAAYRLGAAAAALGLGHIGLLADALGVAWRRRAHASASETAAARPAHPIVEAPDAPALEQAAEALRAILHKIAAGIAPTDGSAALAVLTHAIERGGT